MSLTEETEEQSIDRMLRQMGIRLPELEPADAEPLPPMPSLGAEIIPLPDEFSEWLPPPFSS